MAFIFNNLIGARLQLCHTNTHPLTFLVKVWLSDLSLDHSTQSQKLLDSGVDYLHLDVMDG